MFIRIIFAQFFFWLSFFSFSTSQASQPLSNSEIFQKLAHEIVLHVCQKVGVDSNKSVVIRSRSANPAGDWLLENAFIRYFLNRKIKVQMASNGENSNNLLFEFFISDISVKYEAIAKKKLKRSFTLSADIRVAKNKTETVELIESYSRTFQDTISVDDIKSIESKQYPFTHAEFRQKKNWKYWINPVLVLASTGAVIYSFFALRSK